MSVKILDFVQKRKESVERKRRNFERLMFENVMGVYTVVDNKGAIHPITLIDISREGCLFQVPWNFKEDTKLEKNAELSMRFYFSEKSYIPAIVCVRYMHEYLDDMGRTFIRYGAEFDHEVPSFKALSVFIEFLYQFAEYSKIDHGDPKVYFL